MTLPPPIPVDRWLAAADEPQMPASKTAAAAAPEAGYGRSRRRGKLTMEERRLLEIIAESGKAFGRWPTSPEMVPMDIALRAAERAYRRGVTQGAYFMLWHLRGSIDFRPGDKGETFATKLGNWRRRGARQEYARTELPPGHLDRLRGGAPR
jgi:hypothetical protein